MPLRDQDMERAIATLKNGGVIVFPTETSYGIGCDATNAHAVARIMQIKRRPADQSLPSIVADRAMAAAYGTIDPALEPILSVHWPGPLTVVLSNPHPSLAPHCLHHGTVALRISSHPTAHALVQALGRPVVATSANVHGLPMAYTVEEARRQFAGQEDQPDVYLDGGVLPEVPASMIIECVNGEIVVHRKGSFKL
ncbi:MAG: L-threonylcarbamoyladenylate synthase [Patescibacteria group bacterium]